MPSLEVMTSAVARENPACSDDRKSLLYRIIELGWLALSFQVLSSVEVTV